MIEEEKCRIYIEGVGYRNPSDDYEEIISLFSQVVKDKDLLISTKYWLKLQDIYLDSLINANAHKLIYFLKSQTTTELTKRRTTWHKRFNYNANKHLDNIIDMHYKFKLRQKSVGSISLN